MQGQESSAIKTSTVSPSLALLLLRPVTGLPPFSQDELQDWLGKSLKDLDSWKY